MGIYGLKDVWVMYYIDPMTKQKQLLQISRTKKGMELFRDSILDPKILKEYNLKINEYMPINKWRVLEESEIAKEIEEIKPKVKSNIKYNEQFFPPHLKYDWTKRIMFERRRERDRKNLRKKKEAKIKEDVTNEDISI